MPLRNALDSLEIANGAGKNQEQIFFGMSFKFVGVRGRFSVMELQTFTFKNFSMKNPFSS